MLSSEAVQRELNQAAKELKIIKRVLVFDELSSTNDEAFRQESLGGASGTLIIALEQNNGRGRLGRSWLMPKGNIACSLLLKAEHLPEFGQTLMPFVPALALREALLNLSVHASFKWPNDIVVHKPSWPRPEPSYFLSYFKLGGILLECTLQMSEIKACVIGIGLNLQLPSDFRTMVPHAISLSELVDGVDFVRVVLLLMKSLDQKLSLCQRPDFSELIIREYERHCVSIGPIVEVQLGQEIIRGHALGLNAAGALLVFDGKKNHQVLAGEVQALG